MAFRLFLSGDTIFILFLQPELRIELLTELDMLLNEDAEERKA